MFRMKVDDVFSIRGRGTVLTGKIEQGTLHVGDRVRLNGLTLTVDGIEAFRKVLDQAETGQMVGLLFGALDRGDVDRGDVITGEDGAPADTAATTPAAGGPAAVAGPAVLPAATVAAPAAPAVPAAPGIADARFAAVADQRKQLLSMVETGLTSTEQIDQSLETLAFEAAGRRWKLTAESEHWYSSEPGGGDWHRDDPPGPA